MNNNFLQVQQPLTTPQNSQIDKLADLMKSQSGLVLLGCFASIGILKLISGSNHKGKVATSYWGGSREKSQAAKKAKKQISKPTRNYVGLYVGTPPYIKTALQKQWYSRGLLKTTPKFTQRWLSPNSTLYVPDAQRGIAVIGAAGSGKTFSVIDPLIRSAFDQGFPMLLYDFKFPAQTKRAVAYAMKRGYSVRIFAPGFAESETCNPLDLLRDEEDAIAAGQLTQVISRNFDRGANASSDKFFEEAGDSLVEGILLVTKAIKTLTGEEKYCDLMMAQAILSLPNLAARLEAASKEKLKVWTSRPLSQLISVKDSEKTAASIIGTAQRMFQRFLKRDFVGAFCGQTTLPLDLDGKQLIIFGLDRNNRDIVSPLLAAILHMIVTRNITRTVPRTDPLIVALDELPTFYLPALVNWLNEGREDGFVGILGYQNIAQLEKVYGKELSRAILGGTATKFIFNPQDPESAKIFSDYLGEMEIKFNSKSRSMGKGGGGSSSNEHHQKRHLLEPAQFAKMGTGRAVIINPAYTRGTEAYVPLLHKLKVPAADIDEMNWSESKWDFVRKRLIENNGLQVSDTQRSAQFLERRELAEKLFPLPTDGGDLASPEELNNIF
ncbi:type IV secretory system conjugative DNA transfer family protein [Plectonema cf. radiosum LEGE 06105]|uniref:Type IV secretory system conjugative DNA transfer family protein n=1 Tax=Plectonema cf. radiosum LEGE 06105 TaxID=945769 RepID=A0A8J7F9A6_9CYAN|nr:type IV secretion system DNA-binding domain-containing protein [Plectonema radiosum]MBE9216695.1 type IV secretory system conjugative DNA transfer family protein [Plectonema cf. radiosum LEGE 06105]